MSEDVTFTFYEITHCGYYRRNEKKSVFCNVAEALAALMEWIGKRDTVNTKTFDRKKGQDDEQLPVYCLNLEQHETGDYLLATWNETPSDEGQVFSIHKGSKVGSPKVVPNKLKGIPGHATYFWIMPDLNTIANLGFHNSFSGSRGMNKYLQSYLQRWSPYVVGFDQNIGDLSIEGYSEKEGAKAEKLLPRFRTRRRQNSSSLQKIRKDRSLIRSIVHKATLHPEKTVEETLGQMLFRKLGVGSSPFPNNALQVEYKIPYTPTEDEIERIVTAYEESDDDWDDVGFYFKKSQTPYWLGGTVARHAAKMDVKRLTDGQLIDTGALLDAIVEQRSHLLRYAGELKGQPKVAKGG